MIRYCTHCWLFCERRSEMRIYDYEGKKMVAYFTFCRSLDYFLHGSKHSEESLEGLSSLFG